MASYDVVFFLAAQGLCKTTHTRCTYPGSCGCRATARIRGLIAKKAAFFGRVPLPVRRYSVHAARTRQLGTREQSKEARGKRHARVSRKKRSVEEQFGAAST